MSDMMSNEPGDSAPTPASPPPPPTPSEEWGPPGAVRGPLFVILIGIVTLGIYWIYWWFKVFQEMKDHTKQGIGGGAALAIGLITLFFCGGLGFLVLAFILPAEVGNMYRRLGEREPVNGVWGLWWFLPIVGGIIWLVYVQRAMNRRWESLGVTKT